jgi:hypothetical protein
MNENPINTVQDSGPGDAVIAEADITLTSMAQRYLNQTRPWVRFLSIMMFIGVVIMILSGVVMLAWGVVGQLSPIGRTFPMPPGRAALLGLLYFILAILYIPPGVFLFRYASAIKFLESNRTAQALENALKRQKSFWRFVGIVTVIYLIFLVAVVAFLIVMAIVLFMRGGSASI